MKRNGHTLAWVVIVTGIVLFVLGLGLSAWSMAPIREYRASHMATGPCPTVLCPEEEVAIQQAQNRAQLTRVLGIAGGVITIGGIVLLRRAERKVEDASIRKPKQLY